MIEITRAKSIYQYKLNKDNQRQIMRRENKHNARWQAFATYASADIARAALLALESRRDKGSTIEARRKQAKDTKP